MTLTETDYALMECCDRCGHTRMSHAGNVLHCERSDCVCEEFAESDEPFAGYWDLQNEMLAMKRDRETAQGEVRKLKGTVADLEAALRSMEDDLTSRWDALKELNNSNEALFEENRSLERLLAEREGRWRRKAKSLLGMW